MTRLGLDPIVQELTRLGKPLTRENWLWLAFPETVPENWEQIVDMPEVLKKLPPGKAYQPTQADRDTAGE